MEFDNFELEVSNYELIGESSLSDNHIFIIKIWISQNVYEIKRSYTNFCDFDFNLRKMFPKSQILECPLQLLNNNTNKVLKSVKTNRKNSLARIINSNEIVSNKRNALNRYLEDILEKPELLRSTELLNFLDIESSNGIDVPQETMSLLEYIIGNERETTITVLREYTVKLEVTATQYIAWRFYTKNKDIGFDISMTGLEGGLLPYQRYKSHEQTVEDIIQIPLNGTLILHWDNSYSKVLSKQLTFVYRVLDADVYNSAAEICLSFTRNKHEFESKRNTLRRVLTSKSTSILANSGIRASMSASSILDYKSSGSNINTNSNNLLYEDMQNEIEQLKNEKITLQMSLSSAELELSKYQEKEEMWHEEIKKRDDLIILYDGGNTNIQRNDMLSELDTEKKKNQELLETIEELKRDNSKYRDLIEDYTRQTRRDSSIQMTLHQQQTTLQNELHEKHLELEALKSNVAVLDSQLQRHKSEKKQLKSYALQLKEKNESLEKYANLWNQNQSVLVNLISEIRPLRLELSEQIEIISSLKLRYIEILSNYNKSVTHNQFTESTNQLLETANHSIHTSEMLCSYAEMKHLVPSSSSSSSSSTVAAASITNKSKNEVEVENPPIAKEPLKIQINTKELTEIISSTPKKNSTPTVIQKQESDDSDEENNQESGKVSAAEEEEEDSLLNSVKSSLWEFGTTMLDVEESIDKFLR